jgi:hypothetical protein
MTHRFAGSILVALLAPPLSPPATAQNPLRDEATLLIRQGDRVIAREDYSITQEADRLVISSVAYYPPRHARVVLEARVEIRNDSLADQTIFRSSDGDERRVAAQFNTTRLTIRMASPRGERVRELPIAARYMVEDDSIFGLAAIPPGMRSGPVRLYAPRSAGRREGTLDYQGFQPVTVLGEDRQLALLQLQTDNGTRRMWYDAAGRLVMIEDGSTNLTVVRVPKDYRF